MKNPPSTIKLKKDGKAFREKILEEFAFECTHDFQRLDLAAHTLDRIVECQEEIKKTGLFITDRFDQRKENVAAKAEREQKIILFRVLRELNLDETVLPTNRPPRR